MKVTLPKSPKIKEKDVNHAIFEIEDLYPGYGVTLGNALRRVLYSSLPGAAITQVKIKGAPHEFSTIKGVREDVLEIILNLKQVYFKLHSEEPQIATIKIKGARKVTAKDIEHPSQVEVANKDAYIATLTSKDATLEAELTIESGLGYVPSEQQEREKVDIGTVALDAIFTPMKKVNFEVENMRVGDRTDYNRLRIEIITNGTISPEDAFEYASNLLVEHFRVVGNLGKKNKAEKAKKKVTKPKTAKKPAKKKPAKKPAAKKLTKKAKKK